jgi:hypothetical protein
MRVLNIFVTVMFIAGNNGIGMHEVNIKLILALQGVELIRKE